MNFKHSGRSGLKLPQTSFGLWHNFGSVDSYENARKMIRRAWELGITHFDLANNYGPEPGTAETNFGKILKQDYAGNRDEMVISTKAGYFMWPGPYGDGGSRKYLLSSLDQSLKRLQLEYVDIFYHHRPDHETPVEESMMALDQAVRQGKALYAGISNYGPEQTREAAAILRELRTPFIIHQVKYSMFSREPEYELFPVLQELGLGCIIFSPLAQGMLTNKYLKSIPKDSRAAKPTGFLQKDAITPERLEKIGWLNDMAKNRGQTLAQMAIAWSLRHPAVTSAIIGASRPDQIDDCMKALENPGFSHDELQWIEGILGGG